MKSMAGEERTLVSEKLSQIEAKGRAQGEMRPELMCGALVGATIAFALTGVAWPAALLTSAVAGAYCGSNNVFG